MLLVVHRDGNSLISFCQQIARFLREKERLSASLKKTSDSLIRSFLVNDSLTVPHFWWVIRSQLLIFGEWSDCSSHSSLKQSGWANCLFFKTYKKTNKKTILFKYFWVNRSFFVSERAIHSEKTSDSLRLLFYHEGHEHLLTVALFWWVTWVNCSWLHIFGEQPERFAHSGSFVMSDLSKFLTVAL